MQSYWMDWNDAVKREFFIWQTIINAAAGIVGFLISWRVLNPRIWKAQAFVRVLKAVSLALLILGAAVICYGGQVLSVGNSLGSQITGRELRTQGHMEILFGCILILVGIVLYIVRKSEANRTTN